MSWSVPDCPSLLNRTGQQAPFLVETNVADIRAGEPCQLVDGEPLLTHVYEFSGFVFHWQMAPIDSACG